VDKRVVVSSLGAEAFSEVVAVGISNLSVARFGEVMERVSDQKTFIGGYESIKSFDWSSFVEDIGKLAVNASQAKTPPPGAYRAVIDNELIGLLLHEAFGHATEGDLVMYRASVLCRRLGERVAGDLVTIVDDGAVPNMPGSTPFDDEGVATKRKVVFDRGVLRTHLYDTYTANIDNRESTDNAKRMGASNTYPDATNILVLPGTSSLDSLVRDMNRGIVVHGTIGERLSNPVSGYLNATVTHGFLVEGGEVKQAVKGVVLAGGAYKLLKEGLAALSKEAEAIVNYIVPAVLLSGVSVAGE
jgi:predicted Zn-dependent protease